VAASTHRANDMQRFWTNNGFQFSVSDIDAERISRHRWTAHTANASGKPYIRTYVHGKTIYLHRMLTGCPPTMRVDHKDTDTLNNMRPNLRVTTHDQNNLNRCGFGLSGYKGVTREKTRFRARITFEEKTRSLGGFATAIEAAKAYDAAAFELFGEFAWLNFPEDYPMSLPDIPRFGDDQ